MDNSDVVIIGGGLVGLAFACALKGSGLQVTLIESQSAPRASDELSSDAAQTASHRSNRDGAQLISGVSPRVSAINGKSRRFLSQIGGWPDDAGCKADYTGMAVWDTQGTASINFSASEIQQDCLGTIVENAAIVATLYDSAMVLDNLKLMYETELESVDSTEAGYAIRLKDGQEIQSRLLVGADGGQSRVKQLAGLKSIDWSYHQTAVVTTVELDQPHDNIARQWFTASGPLALLPLNQPNYCSVVWSSTEPDQILALDAQAFCDQLTRITGKQTQAVLACDKRFSFPLTQRHAVQYTRDGLALIGDAAHTIHPLAGQGVNLGFADAQTLAQTLHQCRLEGQNPGDLKVLKRYENRRKPENMLMAAVMEGFKRLFGSDDPGVRWLRNGGLRLVNGAGPLKTMAAKLAAGA